MARNQTTPAGGRSRQRGKPVQVQAKTPWGFIAGSAVLGLLLIGVVAYAVLNQGAGFRDPVDVADSAVKGVAVAQEDPARNHVDGPVRYPQNPPNGGDHNGTAQQCAVYEQSIPSERAVHSMEHGAVWVTYQPDLPAAQVETLREAVQGDPYLLLSPFPGQGSPVALSAWGRRLSVESATDERVEQFIDAFKNGPQTPEKGAACVGSTATGALPDAAPAPAASVAVPVPSG